MISNILVRTNVICQEISNEQGFLIASASDAEIAKRLDYWELLGLMETNLVRWSPQSLEDRNLTENQRRQRDAFIREGTRDIWPDFSNFQPMPLIRKDTADGVETSKAAERAYNEEGRPAFEQDNPHEQIVQMEAGQNSGGGLPAVEDQSTKIPLSGRRGAGTDESLRSEIVQAESRARLVVIAPPGTGKTHTLIERLTWLIRHSSPDSPREAITVLSFSRAAVAEIVQRVLNKLERGAQDDLRYISIRTFDSFATEMLLTDLDGDLLATKDYEERIALFTSRVKYSGRSAAGNLLDRIQCLLVDEIQDLVGVRADLVLELVRRVLAKGGGVLLLGDPAQAIYDWQSRPGETTSHEFMDKLRAILGPTAKYYELTQYFRYADEQVRAFVAKARDAMGGDGASPDGMRLAELFRDLGAHVTLSDFESMVLEGRKIAILTRNNLEAYQIASWCEYEGIRVDTRAGASREYWPGWISGLTLGFAQDSMSLKMASRRWESILAARTEISFEQAVAFLTAQGVVDNGAINLSALCSRIEQRVPLVNSLGTDSSVVLTTVSTIHRSKGLEFDTVLVLEPESSWQGDPEEIRVFYVAATRARREVRLLARDKSILSWGRKTLGYRRLEHFLLWKQKQNFLLLDGLDCLDMRSVLPARLSGSGESASSDVRSAQAALWEAHAGRIAELNISKAANGNYRVIVKEVGSSSSKAHEICTASRGLTRDLQTITKWFGKYSGEVVGLRNVRVIDLATIALRGEGSPAREYLGAAQLAMVPVPYGEALVDTDRSYS